MLSSTISPRFKVAMLIFPGVDILDVAGPLEIFSLVPYNPNSPDTREPGFEVEVVSQSEIITTSSELRVLRDISIEEATAKAAEYDILLVPGAPPHVIMPLWQSETPELSFVRHFAGLPQISGKTRILFSVCTGALLLGRVGAFANVAATTHHMFFEELREACEQSETLGAKVAEGRYVDAGITKPGLRVISSGGVSSGIDAACHLISTEWSNEKALLVAKLAEYNWRKQEIAE